MTNSPITEKDIEIFSRDLDTRSLDIIWLQLGVKSPKFAKMPDGPEGYRTCRVSWGRDQITHLVKEINPNAAGQAGDTVCGLTRFDRDDRKADLPGWSMGGGVSGPGIAQIKCENCYKTTTKENIS